MAPVVQAVQTNVVASSSTYTVSVPPGVQAGEVLGAVIGLRAGSTATSITATPSGWNLIRGPDIVSGGPMQILSFWRLAVGTESATGSFSWTGTVAGNQSNAMWRISGANPTIPVAASNGQGNASSTTVTFPGVTAVDNSLILASGVIQGETSVSTWSGGLAEWYDSPSGSVGTNTRSCFGAAVNASAGATGNYTTLAAGGNPSAAQLINVQAPALQEIPTQTFQPISFY